MKLVDTPPVINIKNSYANNKKQTNKQTTTTKNKDNKNNTSTHFELLESCL